MRRHGEAFVGIDTGRARNAVAVAEGGREGEVRYLGESNNTPDAATKLVRKLAERYETVQFCYEAGPTGYGLYRQIVALGRSCIVVAPSLKPRGPTGTRQESARFTKRGWHSCRSGFAKLPGRHKPDCALVTDGSLPRARCQLSPSPRSPARSRRSYGQSRGTSNHHRGHLERRDISSVVTERRRKGS